jgi:hypothetical protein
MELTVKIKSVYGNDMIYPVNDTAQKFSNLIGKKTFSKVDLAIISNLGYKITQVMEEYDAKGFHWYVNKAMEV